MNNHRLLTVLLAAALWSGAVCATTAPRAARVLTMEEIFEVAEANSLQLRPSFAAQEEARREIGVARSERLPEINANLSLSYIGDGFTTDRDFSDYRKAPIPHMGNALGISVSQPVYTGGAITAGIRLAELRSTAARYATDMRRDDIRFRLAGFYLDIYKYSNLRAVVEGNLALARKVLAEMDARHVQGVVLRNDITRYELLVSDLELQLLKIDNTLDILNGNLTVTAGLPDSILVVPDSTILARALPAASEDWWRRTALDNAPALRLARTRVEIGRNAERLVKSRRLPSVGLQAGWSMDGPILTEVPPIDRNLSYWYVGVGVSFNLGALYKSDKSLARSRAATFKAVQELDAAEEATALDIRADYIRYMEAYEELKTRQKAVELADRNYRTVSTRYAEGMALVTDMLDAANARLDAGQRLVNARIDIIYFYYKLLFTSGKLIS